MPVEQPVINIQSQVVSMGGRLTKVYRVQVVRGGNSWHEKFTDRELLEAYLRGIRAAFTLTEVGDIAFRGYLDLSLDEGG